MGCHHLNECLECKMNLEPRDKSKDMTLGSGTVNSLMRAQDALCSLDGHGNVSCIENDLMYIKPSGASTFHAHQVCVFRVDTGERVDNGWPPEYRSMEYRPSVDTENHLLLYRNNPDLKAICHSHSKFATAFAIAGRKMSVYCTEHADIFGKPIEIKGLRQDWGVDIRSSNEKAWLLDSHGLVTFSTVDAADAVKIAATVEQLAEKYFIASLLNSAGSLLLMSREDVKEWHDRYVNDYGQKK